MKVFGVEKSAASLEWIRAIGMPIKSDNINNSNLCPFNPAIQKHRSWRRKPVYSGAVHTYGGTSGNIQLIGNVILSVIHQIT